MHASADGTLYFSSFGGARIWRAKRGETTASEFIKRGSNGLSSALGVLADDKSDTLYVCSDDTSAFGVVLPTGDTPTALSCLTSSRRAQGQRPAVGQVTLCNDIAGGEGLLT